MIRSQAWTGLPDNGGFYRRVLFRGVMHSVWGFWLFGRRVTLTYSRHAKEIAA
jgi:hypothetical protein